MNLESVTCARCDDGFEAKAKIVNSNGELFHSGCFVCAQCFRQDGRTSRNVTGITEYLTKDFPT
jgi:hypothetical protein